MKVYHICSDSKPLLNRKQSSEMIKGIVKASNHKGIETKIIMPLYKSLKDSLKVTFLGSGFVEINGKDKYVGVNYYEEDGLEFYLIDNMEYFYNDQIMGLDNDGERFTYFDLAVLEAFRIIDNYPDIIHLYDFTTGLIPHILKSKYKYDDNYVNIRVILTIMDATNQGIYPIEMEQIFSFPTSTILYLDDKINFLKAGIVEADIVTAISKTFYNDSKNKTLNLPLRFSLRDKDEDYVGILSGIDYDYYNPEKDSFIYEHYNVKTFEEGKAANKKAFKKEVGFADTNCMLVGFSSDLNDEKGLDLLADTIESLIWSTDIMFFYIGEGEEKYTSHLYYLANKYPDQFKFYHGKSSELTHKLYASCDMILQPYRYETFSQGQVVAMHYGAVPFVHEAGASKDYIIPFNQYTKEGNGFSFISDNRDDFLKVFDYAYGLYRFDYPTWKKLATRCMKEDFSWDSALEEYIKLYDKLITINKYWHG